MIVSFIVLIVALIFGALAYKDLDNWRTSLNNTNLGIVLEENNKTIDTLEVILENSEIVNVTDEHSDLIEQANNDKDYVSIQDNEDIFKVFVFDIGVLDDESISFNFTQEIDDQNETTTLNNEQIKAILKSDNPKNELKKINPVFDFTNNENVSDEMIKTIIFFNMISQVDAVSRAKLLGTLEIYPKDMITRAIDLLPIENLPISAGEQ